jgi:peptide/nickel transport system substrate-binding protein
MQTISSGNPMTAKTSRLAMALILCGAAMLTHHATAGTPKDTLVIASTFDDIFSFDPAEGYETNEISGNTYERLLKNDPRNPLSLVADAARSWSVSEDGRVFTFEIKPALKFASGNSLTAEDAVYSLQRAVQLDKAPAFILTQLGWSKANVQDKVKQTGPLTLTFETDRVYAPAFVYNCVTANIASIVDKKLLQSNEKDGDWGAGWLKTRHAGSGPYKLREWRANELIALERNDNYTAGPKAKLARVIYRHVKETTTQRLLLEKGDVDIARNLSPGDLAALSDNKDIATTRTAKGGVFYLGLNQKNPNLAKPEVREALKLLVDYDALGDTMLKGIGIVHQNFIPEGIQGASTDRPYRLNIEKARSLLAKAGLPNGFKVTLDVRSVQPLQGVAEAVQQTAKRAGIDIEIIPGDGKQTLTKYRARSHDIYIGRWGADYWDPHAFADAFARNPDNSDDARTKPLAWRNSWFDPEITKATDAALLERDVNKRKALYLDLQAKFRATSPFVILYQQVEVAAFRSDVKGLTIGATLNSTDLTPISK